jgi:hypothetical protein
MDELPGIQLQYLRFTRKQKKYLRFTTKFTVGILSIVTTIVILFQCLVYSAEKNYMEMTKIDSV